MSQARFRITLVGATGTMANKCPKCTVDAVVLVAPSHMAIARVAMNKLRLKVKDANRVRLTLKHAVREHAAGTELPDGDLTQYLCNDGTIAVSIKEMPNRSPPPALIELEPISSPADRMRDGGGSSSTTEEGGVSSIADVLSMPDVLSLISAPLLTRAPPTGANALELQTRRRQAEPRFQRTSGVRAAFRLSATCRSIREAFMACESGPWWRDACQQWSPLLEELRGDSNRSAGGPSGRISWQDLFLKQTMEAKRAWRDEDEYALLLSVCTDTEPGLPREDMSGHHLLPFRTPTQAGASISSGASRSGAGMAVEPIVSVSLGALPPHRGLVRVDGTPLGGGEARLALLRRRDGATLELTESTPLLYSRSSGLCSVPTGAAEAGAKSLSVVFESEDDEEFPHAPPRRFRNSASSSSSSSSWENMSPGTERTEVEQRTARWHARRGRWKPITLELKYTVRAARTAEDERTQCKEAAEAAEAADEASTVLPPAELTPAASASTLPSRTPAAAARARSSSTLASATAVLKSVELRSLPFADYWQVEDEPERDWQPPSQGEAMRESVRASGVNVLAEAWLHPEALTELLHVRPRVEPEF